MPVEWFNWRKRRGSLLHWFKMTLSLYRVYVFGLLGVIVLISFLKGIVGEPRPHFLDSCKPVEGLNCSQGYISKFECSNKELSPLLIRDATRSFPSGHAAFSFYSFAFLSWLFKLRMKEIDSPKLYWAGCGSFLLAASLCSLSRITDHRHHWWDVLAGTTIGVLIAWCMCSQVEEELQDRKKLAFSIRVNKPLQ